MPILTPPTAQWGDKITLDRVFAHWKDSDGVEQKHEITDAHNPCAGIADLKAKHGLKSEDIVVKIEREVWRPETLDTICLRQGTDKASNGHDFARFYERWFIPIRLRERPVRIMEMGVLGGNSLRAFDEYFTHTDVRIYGIELESHYWRPELDSRIGVITGSQSDPKIAAEFADGYFDIIIDDAGHFGREQRLALELWLPKVKPGGIYIIEDLHAGYWPEYNDHGAEKIMSFLFGIVHEINCHGNSKTGNREECMGDGWRRLVKCMTFHKSVVVIERA